MNNNITGGVIWKQLLLFFFPTFFFIRFFYYQIITGSKYRCTDFSGGELVVLIRNRQCI